MTDNRNEVTVDNSVLILIDHQPWVAFAVNSIDPSLLSNNLEGLASSAKALDVPVILPPHLDVVDLSGAHLLIADDVADTGETLHLVAETVRPQVQELRTAVLYEKSRSIVQCDYVWRRTDDWIAFPWSSLPPVTNA